jgi:phosphoethanolamine N-methyltransferase
MLKLAPSKDGKPLRVLDVGCGIGGSTFYFASKYGAQVIALDLSTTSIDLAKQRLPPSISHLVTFVLGDALEMSYEPSSFDVVYSRDALLHVPYEKKPELWKLFHKWLKPSGQLLITDYGCGEVRKDGRTVETTAYCIAV